MKANLERQRGALEVGGNETSHGPPEPLVSAPAELGGGRLSVGVRKLRPVKLGPAHLSPTGEASAGAAPTDTGEWVSSDRGTNPREAEFKTLQNFKFCFKYQKNPRFGGILCLWLCYIFIWIACFLPFFLIFFLWEIFVEGNRGRSWSF